MRRSPATIVQAPGNGVQARTLRSTATAGSSPVWGGGTTTATVFEVIVKLSMKYLLLVALAASVFSPNEMVNVEEAGLNCSRPSSSTVLPAASIGMLMVVFLSAPTGNCPVP